MIRLSGGMKKALRAFADEPDESASTARLVLNGASLSSIKSLVAAGLILGETSSGWRSDRRKRWYRLTEEGRATLEQIGG